MELLASKIYMDCLRATDLGIERVLDELRAQGVNRPRKSVNLLFISMDLTFGAQQYQLKSRLEFNAIIPRT
ncbi:unnamed protein product [Anisakis simplex]|uniref:Resolvase/invertase-type recombinase catalytic domain-containing protein n=1 Tax=Anisakis simplex TaxID=6269 RepID=A0A0M3JLW6_ANISI|nr:unnamed protein product [Anisakis simplex]